MDFETSLSRVFHSCANLCEVAIHMSNALPEADINQCTFINFELWLYVADVGLGLFMFAIAFSYSTNKPPL